MKKTILCLISVLMLSLSAFAQSSEIIHVKVNGLICDFCARATEKVFYQQKEVENIKVDLDAGLVTITLKAEQNMNDNTIKKLISDSGYNVVSIHHQKQSDTDTKE